MSISAHSIPNPKIDPSKRQAVGLKPDGSPDDNDRVEIGNFLNRSEKKLLQKQLSDLAIPVQLKGQ